MGWGGDGCSQDREGTTKKEEARQAGEHQGSPEKEDSRSKARCTVPNKA